MKRKTPHVRKGLKPPPTHLGQQPPRAVEKLAALAQDAAKPVDITLSLDEAHENVVMQVGGLTLNMNAAQVDAIIRALQDHRRKLK